MRIDIKGTIVPNDDAWIYDFLGMDVTCPQKVQSALDSADGEPVDVYIDSGGGDIFAGSTIYSALSEYKGTVNIHVVGLAASAASVIACSGQSDIAPTAMVMVHNVSMVSSGDYHDMDKSSEILQNANKAIAAAYVAKTGMSESEALQMMDSETWLTAKDAVAKGLIDKISENQNNIQLAASLAYLMPKDVYNKIKSMIDSGEKNQEESEKAKAKLNFLKLKGEYRNEI